MVKGETEVTTRKDVLYHSNSAPYAKERQAEQNKGEAGHAPPLLITESRGASNELESNIKKCDVEGP